ncbi:DUF975 family protein [Paenibacillus cremeus]|uniref:DUF975 family protein n=1 Tax=Paenibacillus cremeus TaxID=2163881 RepID=A0A559K5Q2_9BACL|nr:DUF975 family protein [Paenibacillus cremeus]
MATRAELKGRALSHLQGHWGKAVAVTLIVMVISIVLSKLPRVGSLISFVITGPLTLGAAYFYLRLVRQQATNVADIFEGFSRFAQAFLLHLLSSIFVFLWMLLLIVPGIIAGIRYSMAFYILNDNPGLTAMEAIDRSKELMDGHKLQYFKLALSFLGWGLLSVVTLGIGLIWLIPYFAATNASFYENLIQTKQTA